MRVVGWSVVGGGWWVVGRWVVGGCGWHAIHASSVILSGAERSRRTSALVPRILCLVSAPWLECRGNSYAFVSGVAPEAARGIHAEVLRLRSRTRSAQDDRIWMVTTHHPLPPSHFPLFRYSRNPRAFAAAFVSMPTSVSQQTLARASSLAGVSLHTGENVTLTLRPAAPDSGLKFKRIDLPDEPLIDAKIEHVKTVERATTIGEGGVKVHTVEHVLRCARRAGHRQRRHRDERQRAAHRRRQRAALRRAHPPVRARPAGRAAQRVRGARAAAHRNQDRLHPHRRARRPFPYKLHAGRAGRAVYAVPFAGNHPRNLRKGNRPGAHVHLLRGHRTAAGKGAHQGRQPGKRRGRARRRACSARSRCGFPDEFVRHKMLDIVGDLALLGRRIKGHIIAVKPGHPPNAELTRALAKEQAKMAALIPSGKLTSGEGALDINEVMRLLPHRYPFLMIDRVIRSEGEIEAHGRQAGVDQRAVFPGAFSRSPGHAGRAPGRGHGAGGQPAHCCASPSTRAKWDIS